jgi:hypothetical protein
MRLFDKLPRIMQELARRQSLPVTVRAYAKSTRTIQQEQLHALENRGCSLRFASTIAEWAQALR